MSFSPIAKTAVHRVGLLARMTQHLRDGVLQSPLNRSQLFAGMLLSSGFSLGAALAPSPAHAAFAAYDVMHRIAINTYDPICVALYPSPCVKGLSAYVNANSYATEAFPRVTDGPNGNSFYTGPYICPSGASCTATASVSSLSQVPQATGRSTAFASAEYFNLSPGYGRSIATTQVTGSALALNGPKRYAYANASSAALASILQGTRNRLGQVFWRPIITSISTGKVSAVQWHDPLSYVVEDGGATTAAGDLLKITYETSVSGGNPVGFSLPDTATSLTLDFDVDGLFSIDMTNPFVTNPGFLKLQATNGLWTTVEQSGIYSLLTLPTLGSAATWTVAVNDLFNPDGNCPVDAGPNPIVGFCPSYDFSSLASTAELTFNVGGDGAASAVEVPTPFPLLGVGAALSYSRVLRRRIKSISPLAATPAND